MTKPLSERIVEFYESVSTSNPDVLGKIDALYDEHVRFESPIEVRDGRQAFKDSWAHAFQAYDRFAFEDIVQVGQGDDLFALFYTMDLQMKGAPPTPTPTATVFWGKNGKVVKQIDYWDTVGSLAQVNPILDRAYRLAVAWLLAGGPPYDADPPPPIDAEGIYHPTSEEALRALVAETHAAHKQLRFAGSGHSVWEAIVPSHYRTGQDERRLALLDGYRRVLGFKPVGDGSGDVLVEVEAGISVGASPRLVEADPISVVARDDPKTPNITRYRTWEQSLCLALQNKGLALPDLGGISHQTAAGFISTGSAGGTCKWSVSDAVVGLRVVDGKGEVHPLSEDGDDPDWFRAAGLGMGLCGAISTVTFRCCPTFNITGVETTSTTSGAPDVDFYGPGDAKRPSLAKFLLETDYTRLMWWPQRDFDRLVVWKASRIAPTPDFEPKPYEELGKLEQIGASLLYTVLGNLDNPQAILDHASRTFAHPDRDVIDQASASIQAALKDMPPELETTLTDALQDAGEPLHELLGTTPDDLVSQGAGDAIAELIGTLLVKLVQGVLGLPALQRACKLLAKLAPYVIDRILSPFVPLNPDGSPTVKTFQDYWYRGLPMDNGMDDLLMPVFFTEIWIPFSEEGGEVEKTIATLRKVFEADGTPEGAFKATGAFAFELYATKGGTKFFLNPAWGERPVFRVDVFWFGYNAGDPVTDFYPQFWTALDEAGIEYRLHWGKFLPNPDQLAPADLTARFPEWKRFTEVRGRVDPDGVFLSDYWKQHLGL